MDILKLLSRSIKTKNRPNSGSSVALPSAGTSDNPQLFHDPIPEIRGKKRKRREGQTEEKDDTVEQEEEDDEALNFFAATSTSKTSKKSKREDHGEASPKSASKSVAPIKLLDEDECKQILRSHRLKLMLLSSSKPPEKKVKKSKKVKPSKAVESNKNKNIYPQPLTAFNHLRSAYGISKRLGENLAAQGYKMPTEVQMGSLPLLLQPGTALKQSTEELAGLSNIDLLTVAPTGSGKTLAFLIPVVDSIIQRRSADMDKESHDLQAIIVAPTKELANQIVNEGKKLCLGTGVRVNRMRKGMRITPDSSKGPGQQESSEEEVDDESEEEEAKTKTKTKTAQPMSRGEILVTTPGLLLSSLSTGVANKHHPLSTVRTLVLDEADWLLDAQFKDETLGIWEACTNPDLRVTLWSATMGSNIEALATATIQSRRATLNLSNDSTIVRLIVGLKDSAIPNVTHRLVYAATEPGKLIAIRQLLHPTSTSTDGTQSLRPPFLVFTQTIPRAKALHSELLYDIPAEAGGSTRIAVLHSDLSDSAREQVMTRFRKGEIWVLITTDILSRGVDFRGVNGVVNFDFPTSGATYVHRVGRTGRAGRAGGIAVTLYTKEDIPHVKNIANIIAASEKEAGIPEEESSVRKWLLDALPTPTKEGKKKLKKYGVEARRTGLDAKDKSKAQISTKSGYERKLENNRRGAIKGSQRRMQAEAELDAESDASAEGEWAGIET